MNSSVSDGKSFVLVYKYNEFVMNWANSAIKNLHFHAANDIEDKNA